MSEAINTLEASYRPLLDAIVDWATVTPNVHGVFLSGSLTNGSADQYSDLDVVLVGAELDLGSVHGVIATVEPIIIANELPPGPKPFILSVVTEAWHRLDVVIATAPPPGVVPVYNPSDLAIPLSSPAPAPNPSAVQLLQIINEFFRLLGLSVVVLGRRDVHAAREGAELLRQRLIELLLLEVPAHRPGPKKLLPALSDKQRAILRALPPLKDEERSIRTFSAAIDPVFVERAKALLSDLGGAWPDDVERATRRYLEAGTTNR